MKARRNGGRCWQVTGWRIKWCGPWVDKVPRPLSVSIKRNEGCLTGDARQPGTL